MDESYNGKKLIDVACGTGDIAKLFLDYTNNDENIYCLDPNKGMIKQGKEKLKKYKNINGCGSAKNFHLKKVHLTTTQ